jgi:hypothetical protein
MDVATLIALMLGPLAADIGRLLLHGVAAFVQQGWWGPLASGIIVQS